MKKIVISIFALTCLTVQAQNFTTEALDTTLYGLATDNTFYGDIDLYNNLGSTFTLNWERIEESVPVGWTTSNCDPFECHPVGVTSESFELPVGTSYLNTHFNPNDVAGSGYMKVKLWESSNPSDSVILTYYGVAGSLGIDDLEASDIQVFPSPAQNTLNIMLPHPGETITADILNVTGQRVDSFVITEGNITNRDVSKLKAGIYMIHFNISGNEVIKKFVKQ